MALDAWLGCMWHASGDIEAEEEKRRKCRKLKISHRQVGKSTLQ